MFSIIQAAGWPIWLLLPASVLAVALIVERAVALRRARILPARLLEEVMSAANGRRLTPEALRQLDRSSPLGRVLATGLRQAGASREVIKESIEETGRAVAHELERYLSTLGTIATAAPLLGLFGTVIGMIELFGAQGPGGVANPQQLAHGISIALYNTAFGLVVAIPALVAYRTYRARVDGFLVEMEQQAIRLVEMLRPGADPATAAAGAAPRGPRP